MIRLMQLTHPHEGRRIAIIEDNTIHLLAHYRSIYHLAEEAIDSKKKIAQLMPSLERKASMPYDPIYNGTNDWKILPAFDHPGESTRCFVTGTGLTHKPSAENRQSMHASTPSPGTPGEVRPALSNVEGGEGSSSQPLTDSMKMYQLGIEGGRPRQGEIGISPEWFYKGTGSILRAHNQPLEVPAHAEDGGDEAEIAGVYMIDGNGQPFRVGMVQGNEFSDHIFEAKNYLYLASSKLRTCSIGPELIVDAEFSDVPGEIKIERAGETVWQSKLNTGDTHMSHHVANLEHHHFKHEFHRQPGDVHIHFFGADMFSFKDRLKLENGDVMSITFKNFGRPLRNPIRIAAEKEELVAVKSL